MVRVDRGVVPHLIAIAAIFAAMVPLAHAGTLTLGPPTVDGGQYTFPIELQAGGGQISALDFRVQFDPQVFQPVSAVAGNAALAANKMVSANYAAPGEYVVVMMGLNQTPVGSGQVATVVMQRVGTEELVSSPVSIANPTLATPDGAELPASGSTVTVPLGGKPPAEGENTPDDDNGEQPGEGVPGSPEKPQTPPKTPQTAPAPPTTPLRPSSQGMLAGLPEVGGEPPNPLAPASPDPGGNPEKKGGLQMPIVLGSETPEAGIAARQAAAGTSNSTSRRANMASTGASAPQDGTVVSVDEKIESTRKENTPPSSTGKPIDGGESPEGETQGMTLVFAGVIAVLLLGAAVMLRKFSSR